MGTIIKTFYVRLFTDHSTRKSKTINSLMCPLGIEKYYRFFLSATIILRYNTTCDV